MPDAAMVATSIVSSGEHGPVAALEPREGVGPVQGHSRVWWVCSGLWARLRVWNLLEGRQEPWEVLERGGT